MLRIAYWLESEWSKKVADNFVKKLSEKVQRLIISPYAGSPTRKDKNIRKLSVDSHYKIYYKVSGYTITIIALFETSQDPKRNKYE
ncbi:MAG: type II toxin-antitoxin system RelE/ParE family toxin [Bacteroidetes bacterium]|nr:type II toxin-antitoxin system RelE/ParE family toxin [Bacteroidota bacterium]